MLDKNGLYSLKLTFKKNTQTVAVEIRQSKLGRARKREIPIPEDIGQADLYWFKYQGLAISIYHRKTRDGDYLYKDSRHVKAPIVLSQKLENIVNKICSEINSD